MTFSKLSPAIQKKAAAHTGSGTNGAVGLTGATGATGVTGLKGDPGARIVADRVPGTPGADGAQCPQGGSDLPGNGSTTFVTASDAPVGTSVLDQTVTGKSVVAFLPAAVASAGNDPARKGAEGRGSGPPLLRSRARPARRTLRSSS